MSMKTTGRSFTILAEVMLLSAAVIGAGLAFCPVSVYADDQYTFPDSGQCGDNVTYQMGSDGTLTISGSGPMYDYQIADGVSNPPFYWSKDQIRKIVVEAGVTSIGNDAFTKRDSVTSVSLPESLRTIGSGAFNDCSSLTEINIPDGLTSIGKYAFYNTAISDLPLPDSITSLEGNSLFGLRNVHELAIPSGVKELEPAAIGHDDVLTSVYLPSSLTSIDEGNFYDCPALTDLYYEGSEDDWNRINNQVGVPDGCQIHFNSTPNTGSDTAQQTQKESGQQAGVVVQFQYGEYGHYYGLVPTDSFATFEDAEAWCESYGGHIASVEGEADERFLKENFRDYANSWYIGLRYQENDRKWEWADGSTSDWTWWNQFEAPDQPGSMTCVMDQGGHWVTNSWHNEGGYYLICDFGEPGEKITKRLPDQIIGKPLDDKMHEYRGHKYALYKNRYDTFQDAEAYCESLGGHLAVITSEAENEFLAFDFERSYVGSSHYIGIVGQNGEWKWVDGTPVGFTRWSEGSEGGCNGENEAYICIGGRGLGWAGDGWYPGNDAFNLLCEFDPEVEQVDIVDIPMMQTDSSDSSDMDYSYSTTDESSDTDTTDLEYSDAESSTESGITDSADTAVDADRSADSTGREKATMAVGESALLLIGILAVIFFL